MTEEDQAVTSSESATEQAEPSATPAEAQDTSKAVPSEREKLIKALTEGTVDKLDNVPDEEPVAEAEKAEGDENAAEAAGSTEEAKVQDAPAKAATKEEAEKTETETKTEEVEDDEKVSDDDVVKDTSRTRKRITKLREQAAFGSLITTIGVRAGIPPQDMTNWIALRAGLAQNDPRAKEFIVGLAKQLDPTLAAKMAEPPAQVDPAKEIEAEADKIYKEVYEPGVKALQVDEEFARAEAKKVAGRRVYAKKSDEPKPQQQAQSTQVVPQSDPLTEAATAEVNNMDREMGAKVAGWDKMRNEVYEEIASKHRGAPPARWSAIFLEVAKNVQAKHAKPAEKRAAVTPALRGAGTTAGQTGSSSLTGRQEALAILTGKKKI